MEMMQVSALVERLTDDQLMEEMQRPSGMAPLQVIIAEMQRRASLRGGKPRGFATGGLVEDPEARAAAIWQAVQALPGAHKTSGYRSQERQNQLIAQGAPAARNSRHTSGRAVDWTMPGSMSRDQVEGTLRSRGLPFEDVIFHPENNSWHVEMPPDWEPGTQAPSAPASPVMANGSFPDPQALTQQALSIGDVMAGRMGLPAEVQGLPAQFAEVAGLMPDTNAAYDNAIKRLTQAEKDAVRGSRGRPWMEAGLAMMGAQTPDFMSALAAGGTAGLSAHDRIKEQQRGLMNGVIQAQLAKSQIEAQNARANLEAAAGQTNSQRSALAQAYGMGSDISRAGGQVAVAAAEDRTRRDLSATEIAARERIAKFEADSRLDQIRETVKVQAETDANPEQIYQRLLQASLGRVGERIMTPGPDGSPEMKIYTREDAIRDAQEGTTAAMAYRTAGAQQPDTGPVRSTTSPVNRKPLAEIFGD